MQRVRSCLSPWRHSPLTEEGGRAVLLERNKRRASRQPAGKRQPPQRQRHTDKDSDFFGQSSVQTKGCLYPHGSPSSPAAKARTWR